MKRSPMPRRRTPMARKPFRPVVRLRPVRAREGVALYHELRQVLCEREHGLCARCGKPGQSLPVGQCHHRLLRSQGGTDDAWTCVWLCASCHEWAHHNPKAAKASGWIVPPWADARQWPCLRRERWQQPTPTGWVDAKPQEGQAA